MDSMEGKTMNLHPETRPAEAYKPFPTGSKPERGQSLVEFSISAVIILILLMGVIDFGWAYFTVVALNDAAQEGATYGSICPNDTGGIVLRLEESAQDPVRLNAILDQNVFVCVVQAGGSTCGAPVQVGNDIQVRVEYPHQILTPLIGSIIGTQEITLSGRAKSRIVKTTCMQ
jgi:hypothetical protein